MTVQKEPTATYEPDFEHLLACDRLHGSLMEAAERLEVFVPDAQEFTFEGVPAGRSGLARLEGTFKRQGDVISDAYLRFTGGNPDSDKRQFRFIRSKQRIQEWQIGDHSRDNAGMIKALRRNLGIDKFDTDAWLTGADLDNPVSDTEVATLIGELGTMYGETHELTRVFKTYPDKATNRDEVRKGAVMAVIDGTEHAGNIVVVEIDESFDLAGGNVPIHVTVAAFPDGVVDLQIKATTPGGKEMRYFAEDFPEVINIVLEHVEELIEVKTDELYAA